MSLQNANAQHHPKRHLSCNIDYGQEIYFDANNKCQSGKWIPLDNIHSATTVPATIIEGIQSARKLSHLIYHFYHVFYLNEMIVKIS